MKLRVNVPVVAAFAAGVVAAGGLVWASGGSGGADEQWCRTKAGYLRMSTTGECRRAEVAVDLPQGPQGEPGVQGEPGEQGPQGEPGADGNVESVRCFQRLTAGVDLHGCTLRDSDFASQTDLTDANLTGVSVQPSAVSGPPILASSRGYTHCMLTSYGLGDSCWGWAQATSNAPLSFTSTEFTSLGVGVWHTCGVKPNHDAVCWGTSGYGQLAKTLVHDAKQVAVGDISTCVLLLNATVDCFGNNYYGQTNVPSGLTDIQQVVAGGLFNCALTGDGTARCWGLASNGGGDVTPPAGLPKLKKLFATYRVPCGIDFDGVLHCWGAQYSGAMTLPADLSTVKSIDGGDRFMCAIDVNDSLTCWGQGSAGMPKGVAATQMSAGFYDVCAVLVSQQVQCWGDNGYGQLNAPAPKAAASSGGVVVLTGANVQGADLKGLRAASLVGCNVSGSPAALPDGWQIVDGCVRRSGV